MEVDDDGARGTIGSHWKMRTAKDDLMAGYIGHVMFLSPMTLAYMEDAGLYTPDYDKANILPFGYGAGCNFVRKPCISDGVSAYPQYFPTSNSTRLCTSDYSAVGRVASRSSLCSDKIYDYFGDGVCNTHAYMDFCPYYGEWERCPTSDTEWTSRCFNIFDESGAACLNISCDFDAQTYTVGGVTCAPGERVTLNGAVYRCLHFYEACPYRKTDGLRKPCTPHCKRCTNGVCDSCDEPYILSASNTCESPPSDCTPNCKRCSNNYCVQCEDQYIATPESALCVRKVENCNSISNDGKCISCDGGRKPSGDGSKCVSKGVPWWVWLIVGIVAAVIIVVLIVVVLCCCYGGSAGPDDEDESSYSSQAPSDSCSDSFSESDGSSHSSW
ncbi:Leishmanolysin, putative [Angomonas deanei]|uniref:Leishmanolysin-like peptidase n=1 Tax=Angomonas deanei TaxID=59799 RepID=A0A7G2CK25_9TRYP|nr:Leishmanolysin, putative [Angomonas deanei]